MPVLPVRTGEVKVTISAISFMGKDEVTKTVNIEMDGVTNYFNTPYLIDLINHGSLMIPDLEIPVPERFIYPERRQHIYVPGSAYAYVGIVGKTFKPYLTG